MQSSDAPNSLDYRGGFKVVLIEHFSGKKMKFEVEELKSNSKRKLQESVAGSMHRPHGLAGVSRKFHGGLV